MLFAQHILPASATKAYPPQNVATAPARQNAPSCSLKAHGIEASMHIYPSGGHGWGIRDSFRYKAQWQDAVLDWLRRINE